jgi:DNA-binding CsgD family transcriptional regulator
MRRWHASFYNNTLNFAKQTKMKIQTPTVFQRDLRAAQGMEQLTPREREILILLAQGGYYREIGESLGISTCTVRTHLHSVYKKLGVNSRGRAVVKFHAHNRTKRRKGLRAD